MPFANNAAFVHIQFPYQCHTIGSGLMRRNRAKCSGEWMAVQKASQTMNESMKIINLYAEILVDNSQLESNDLQWKELK